MIQILDHTKTWVLTSIAFGLLLAIRSIPAAHEYLGFIVIWLLLFEILSFITSDRENSHLILDMLFILTAFGIAVQCLMNQEGLLSTSLKDRQFLYPAALVTGTIASRILRTVIIKLPVRTAEIVWFVLHNALLGFICINGEWESGTLKHIVLGNTPIQITVLTKLTAVLFMAAVMKDKTLKENVKIYITAGFTLLNAVWFIYMKELGTFMIIAVLHLIMIAGFIRPVCRLKRKYILFLGFSMAAGVLFITAVIPLIGVQSAFFEKIQVRLAGVYDPSLLDPSDAGYSVNAARKSILIGGTFGSSLNHHIPEANTDLAFSYVFLRFGVVISLLIMLLYCGFLCSMLISSSNKTPAESTYAYGMAAVLSVQTFYNIAMCLGILPICGINLTFISAGTMDLLTGLIMTIYVIISKGRRREHHV